MLDLHCHSTFSDGTLPPEQIAVAGREFSLLALTDHDNCDGTARFMNACVGQNGVRLIGIELGVGPFLCYSGFHLLGIGVDPGAAALKTLMDEIRVSRLERNRQIVARLAELGMPIADEEIFAQIDGGGFGRRGIVRALVNHGWAVCAEDAKNRLLGRGRPGYVARRRPGPVLAIETIHAAGGIAVMAHPQRWTNSFTQLRSGLGALKSLGLDGLEAIYPGNRSDETQAYLHIASQLGLVVTAGSDFHGANKPSVPLGMSVDNETEFIAAILESLGKMK